MKLIIENEDCLSISNDKGEEILHVEYDYTMADTADEVVKLVEYINKEVS